MNSLKTEFIKYLEEKYLDRINEDINEMLVSIKETGILLRTDVVDLSALDTDELEFIFKVKTRSEVLKIDGNPKLYSFEVEYSCLLNNGIHNLVLRSVKEINFGKFPYKDALTDSFIPLNKKENYEKLAHRFLKYYLKENYKQYPLNVMELVNKVGVRIYTSTNFDDSLGKVIFKNCEVQLTQDIQKVRIEKGSIIINLKNMYLTGNNKLARTTIVHECLHWHYHRKAFEIIMLLNDQYKYFDFSEYSQNDTDPIKSALAWMEVQAYAVTKSCMMLEDNVRKYITDSFDELKKHHNSAVDLIDYYYSVVNSISDAFGTTLSDTVKRLIFLGYEEVGSLRNEYYGSYVDSVAQNENLNEHQTRRISKQIYDYMIKNSPNLMLAIQSGLYVFAEGFVVIKSPEYVIRIGDNYILNSYSRNHIEECSLIFNITKSYKSKFNASNALQFITANSSIGNATILIGDTDSYVIAPFMLNSILEQDEPIRSHILKNSYIHEDKFSFSEYFKILIEKYGFSSVKDLMEVTHCSRSVIENYRDLDDTPYSVEKVLSICAGMRLLPPESKHLIKKSGVIDLKSDSKRSKIYKHLVENCWNEGIEKWNKLLSDSHVPLLYNDF